MTGRDRGNATATRTTMPTKRRPIVIDPGEKVPARARIATNDEAHIVTVIIAAPNARDSVDNRIASLASFLRSIEARDQFGVLDGHDPTACVRDDRVGMRHGSFRSLGSRRGPYYEFP